MNCSKKLISLVVLFTFLGGVGPTYAFQTKPSIVGSWLMENDPEQKMVFTSDGKVKKYIHTDELFKTYNWTIHKETTPSGLEVIDLVLVNVQNPEETYNYVVTTLTEQYLGLAKAENGNLSPTTYIRMN